MVITTADSRRASAGGPDGLDRFGESSAAAPTARLVDAIGRLRSGDADWRRDRRAPVDAKNRRTYIHSRPKEANGVIIEHRGVETDRDTWTALEPCAAPRQVKHGGDVSSVAFEPHPRLWVAAGRAYMVTTLRYDPRVRAYVTEEGRRARRVTQTYAESLSTRTAATSNGPACMYWAARGGESRQARAGPAPDVSVSTSRNHECTVETTGPAGGRRAYHGRPTEQHGSSDTGRTERSADGRGVNRGRGSGPRVPNRRGGPRTA